MSNRLADALVEIRDLHFAHGDRQVLKGINLAIPRGKVVAILGVSGCGKTTLLRHVGGQLKPARGSVSFDGQVVIRPMMYLALTYDHRLIDGRDAVQFLVAVKAALESPAGLLTDA